MRAAAARIGLYRVAALLIGGALVLEIVRVQLVAGRAGEIACTVGEIAFLAAGAAVVVAARRVRARGG